MTSSGATPNFVEVSLETLQVGMLLERPIYVYLEKNKHYVLLVKKFYPLEAGTFGKIKKIKNAHSAEAGLEETKPELLHAVNTIRDICAAEDLAPFEKQASIVRGLAWLQPSPKFDADAAVFFIHRTFEVPRAETLMFVSDLSVDMYLRVLRVAAAAGTIALWLGYSDRTFIAQFVETVFCEEIGVYRTPNGQLLKGEAAHALRIQSRQLVESASVPGMGKPDMRFLDWLDSNSRTRAVGEEIFDIVAVAKRLISETTGAIVNDRVSVKLDEIWRPAKEAA